MRINWLKKISYLIFAIWIVVYEIRNTILFFSHMKFLIPMRAIHSVGLNLIKNVWKIIMDQVDLITLIRMKVSWICVIIKETKKCRQNLVRHPAI